MIWVRKRGDVFAEWHLVPVVQPGIVTSACGLNLGDLWLLEQVDEESVIGSRCSACQGYALGGISRS
jgi:hypothetical protein